MHHVAVIATRKTKRARMHLAYSLDADVIPVFEARCSVDYSVSESVRERCLAALRVTVQFAWVDCWKNDRALQTNTASNEYSASVHINKLWSSPDHLTLSHLYIREIGLPLHLL